MTYEILLCWELFALAIVSMYAVALGYKLRTRKETKLSPTLLKLSIACLTFAFLAVVLDIIHVIVITDLDLSILNLFQPTVYVVFNIADGCWFAETITLYLLYAGRVYITFRKSPKFAISRTFKIFFATLIVVDAATYLFYYYCVFFGVNMPVSIFDSLINGINLRFCIRAFGQALSHLKAHELK